MWFGAKNLKNEAPTGSSKMSRKIQNMNNEHTRPIITAENDEGAQNMKT
jgi:hypothetical protein